VRHSLTAGVLAFAFAARTQECEVGLTVVSPWLATSSQTAGASEIDGQLGDEM
jgi:hypothetical protein